MVKMYIRHKVADFAKWKVAYDEHEPIRKQFGFIKSDVFVNSQNPTDVLSVHLNESKGQAVKFTESPNLREAMVKAGVVGVPEFDFTE
jgi:hypothetical protein